MGELDETKLIETISYGYDDNDWGDLLISYNGKTITYDEIGNPLSDGTWAYTWEHGRQLASMNTQTVTLDYEYNSDGIRTKKTVTTLSDHVHSFQDTVHQPKCTENGYTLHECICGYIYQDSPVPATGHDFTTTVVGTSCTEVGHTVYTCECGYSYEDGSNGHTFTTLVVEPSETVNGLTLHECECGYIYESDPVASLAGASSAVDIISNTKVYDYVYNGSSLTKLTITTTITGDGTSTEELYFAYDGSSPMTVTYNGDVFYYVTNLQGDVVAILDATGTAVVEYSYDAWGNILDIGGSMKDDLGVANPLTYRGYVYDEESELYYLQSRYYNPEVGRFLNADALMSTGQGLLGNNMFAYCKNNPIAYCDSSGYVPQRSDITTIHAMEYGETWNWRFYRPEIVGTRTIGVSISGGIGAAGAASMGITYDKEGNIGIIITRSYGSGSPSWAVNRFVTFTNAKTIYELEGFGTTSGFSAATGTPLSAGYDRSTGYDEHGKVAYKGNTFSLGGGAEVLGEVHAYIDESWVYGFNIYEVVDKLISALSIKEEANNVN